VAVGIAHERDRDLELFEEAGLRDRLGAGFDGPVEEPLRVVGR